jgi:hypothetical protein
MHFERGKDPKQALGIGQYVYDHGFGPRKYVCIKCKGTKLEIKHRGGFQPPFYVCQDCGEINYAPQWIDL